MYQGVVFYAQWNLVTSEQCIKINNDWSCDHLVGAEAMWIIIETVSFYTYMAAAFIYILRYQCKSTFKNEKFSDL